MLSGGRDGDCSLVSENLEEKKAMVTERNKRSIGTLTLSTLLLLALLVVAGMALTACSTDNNGYGTSNTGAKLTNSELEKAIKTKLDTNSELRAADLRVSADAEKSTATISGTVESPALRTTAIDLAKSAYSGLLVNDKIEVKQRELTRAEWTEEKASEARAKGKEFGDTIGESLDDAWIHTKIVTKMIGNEATPQRKINVDVNNNVVTLRGVVDTNEAKVEAERVASGTEGVRRVINQLKVKKV